MGTIVSLASVRVRGAGLMLACFAALPGGCSRNPEVEIRGSGFSRVFTPQVPVFLCGPAGAILTNANGFSARAALQSDATTAQMQPLAGELLGRGSLLLFAPRKSETKEKGPAGSGFSYVWDVATASGFVLSEALQGYAPVSSQLRVTNLVLGTSAAGGKDATVTMSDGSNSSFRVSKETGPDGIPLRISSLTGPPLALNLSKIRRQAPPSELFAPPDGFTRYATAEALADELAARQQNLRRGGRPAEPLGIPVTTPK